MKVLKLLLSIALGLTFVLGLNGPMKIKETSIPPLGKLFDPFNGFWKNAEHKDGVQLTDLSGFEDLKSEVRVYFDDRRVPHIFSENLKDAVFVQGYITASQRLFQMDLTIRASGGRLSEILGERTLKQDRLQRRRGMVYAAENTLANWKNTPASYQLLEAYCKGVNAYIEQMDYADYPLEYKLLNFSPELWTPLKSALLMKSMAQVLSSREKDLESSNALHLMGRDTFDSLFPEYNPDEIPIIPTSEDWDYIKSDLTEIEQEDSNNAIGLIDHRSNPKPMESLGSNNWAVHGSKTQSGVPILCNDPHLRLTLPSVWYEVQLNVDPLNVYGVSLPGFPGVVIGFNENVAWGMTNVSHDVMDWYTIDWVDSKKTAYLLDGQKETANLRIEKIMVKGRSEPVIDTVRYTKWGPVVYENEESEYKDMAMKWLAHEGHGNELNVFYQLGQMTNYQEYTERTRDFASPAQNIVFASQEGDIALRVQGKFPIRKEEQGRFVLDGSQSANDWSGYIPHEHNPRVYNPTSGFVASANQRSTGKDYPYYYTGGFADYRGRILSRKLSEMDNVTVKDMMALQNDEYGLKAEEALPALLKSLEAASLSDEGKTIQEILSKWDYEYHKDAIAPIYFEEWLRLFYRKTWDEFYVHKDSIDLLMPETWKTISLLKNKPNHGYFDIQSSSEKEDASQIAILAFNEMMDNIEQWKIENKDKSFVWSKYKGDRIRHLARLPGFSTEVLEVGGDRNVLNAIRNGAGPSWRMIVELGEEIKAYGIYPGGQSGNPGSPHYDDMVEDWAKGEYYELNFLKTPPTDKSMLVQKFSNK